MCQKPKIWIWIVLIFILTGCSTHPKPEAIATVTNIPASKATSTNIPTSTATLTETPAQVPTGMPTHPPQTGTDAATFISESYSDYSALTPGEQFIKTWDIKNTGTTTWYSQSYELVIDATPQNETLGSPVKIPFPHDVAPGETVTLSIPLIAPTVPGTYAVYWTLKNDRAESFGVDGDKVWAIIMVCASGSSCLPPQSGGTATTNGVSATLTGFASRVQNATAKFCMTFPNRNYGPAPGSVFLTFDQESALASSGWMLGVGCFEFEFPVTEIQISQAASVAVSINQVRILGGVSNPQVACETARFNLVTQYPGLDFQCNFSVAGYYTNLSLPAGMDATKAEQIIVDAIEGAIYGPWVLSIAE